ncbi:transketolase [Candidatus Atribacteria bacterium RBG_19FT_COMBO_35_14]|uniref:Transketolase n=1 Tax=Candidatus Sediminicultor quintus TaxID=1797291 RepID=A0A1F5AF65_9BACT|nr:MAG: transketolase [Candidatus Atribacteria bacterium RBG_19FT_COMBO_35_14]
MKNKLIATRNAFGEALVELAKERNDIVVLDADVASSTKTSIFKEAFPDRFFEMGIAEQNMMGVAAGMASTKKIIPFTVTFAVFATKRACDQISISIAYPKLNVKVVGSYGGIPTGKAGATHQAFEDIAIMRTMPNMTIIVPADAVEMKHAVRACVEYNGPVYLRCIRCETPVIFDENYKFEWNKGVTLRDGKDITIVSTGIMTSKALVATNILTEQGIDVQLIHLHTIKPIDKEILLRASKQTRHIVTVENHSIIGGLGGAVAEVLSEGAPALIKRIGIKDIFGESGSDEDLFNKYGLTSENIVKEVKEIIKKKTNKFYNF